MGVLAAQCYPTQYGVAGLVLPASTAPTGVGNAYLPILIDLNTPWGPPRTAAV